MGIAKFLRVFFLPLLLGCVPKDETAEQSAVDDWKLHQDASLEFKFPAGYEVRTGENTWMAARWEKGSPLLGASLMIWTDPKEARDLMTHYETSKAAVAGRHIGQPRRTRINAADCLLYDTEESLNAYCYSQTSLFYEVSTTIKSLDMPEGMTRQILAANFEKFLRSIKIKS